MEIQPNSALEAVNILQEEMERSVIGQSYVVEGMVLALLANGNVLVEGPPGHAKTRSVKSMANGPSQMKVNTPVLLVGARG
jgi:MoxR-like ATPase